MDALEDKSTIPLEASAFWPYEPENYFKDDDDFENKCLGPFADKLEPGARVLDLACGVGVETRDLEAKGFEVWPIDGNPKFIKLIKNKFPDFLTSPIGRMVYSFATQNKVISRAFEKLGFGLEASQRKMITDAYQLPLADNSFGGVLCKHFLTFGNDEDRLAILQQIYRVLKPGGVLAIYNESRDQPVLKDNAIRVHPINPTIAKSLLKETGFSGVEISTTTSETSRWQSADRNIVVFAKK